MLVYPVTDFDESRPSYREFGSGPETFLTLEDMRWFIDHYLPDESSRRHPDAAPLRAEDHSGLAPAVVVTAEYDPLRDEGLEYVDRLRAAGVSVTHRHYDDMIHHFFVLVNVLERGNQAVEAVGADIRALASYPAAGVPSSSGGSVTP